MRIGRNRHDDIGTRLAVQCQRVAVGGAAFDDLGGAGALHNDDAIAVVVGDVDRQRRHAQGMVEAVATVDRGRDRTAVRSFEHEVIDGIDRHRLRDIPVGRGEGQRRRIDAHLGADHIQHDIGGGLTGQHHGVGVAGAAFGDIGAARSLHGGDAGAVVLGDRQGHCRRRRERRRRGIGVVGIGTADAVADQGGVGGADGLIDGVVDDADGEGLRDVPVGSSEGQRRAAIAFAIDHYIGGIEAGGNGDVSGRLRIQHGAVAGGGCRRGFIERGADQVEGDAGDIVVGDVDDHIIGIDDGVLRIGRGAGLHDVDCVRTLDHHVIDRGHSDGLRNRPIGRSERQRVDAIGIAIDRDLRGSERQVDLHRCGRLTAEHDGVGVRSRPGFIDHQRGRGDEDAGGFVIADGDQLTARRADTQGRCGRGQSEIDGLVALVDGIGDDADRDGTNGAIGIGGTEADRRHRHTEIGADGSGTARGVEGHHRRALQGRRTHTIGHQIEHRIGGVGADRLRRICGSDAESDAGAVVVDDADRMSARGSNRGRPGDRTKTQRKAFVAFNEYVVVDGADNRGDHGRWRASGEADIAGGHGVVGGCAGRAGRVADLHTERRLQLRSTATTAGNDQVERHRTAAGRFTNIAARRSESDGRGLIIDDGDDVRAGGGAECRGQDQTQGQRVVSFQQPIIDDVHVDRQGAVVRTACREAHLGEGHAEVGGFRRAQCGHDIGGHVR